MTLLTQAIAFAAQAHEGATRKGSAIPYIVHPMEAMAIAASVTDDQEVLAAAVLHDVIEDCGVTAGELRERFGTRVAELVAYDSQTKRDDPCASWNARKREAVGRIACGCREAKIITLADKLSNMRAIRHDYERDGEAMFYRFHQHDKRRHAWYYHSCVALLEDELGETDAWRELEALVYEVFGEPEIAHEEERECAV
ncbi:MAG: HD domain-containing protein [Clostridia bacterium]|nr:HD domain-containing protein [Clostridia bacterium]